MTRTILATLMAASLTLSPMAATTAQAQTNNDQLARILAGAATVAIIGLALRHDKKHDRKVQARNAQPRFDDRIHDRKAYRQNLPRQRHQQPHYRKNVRKAVPGACLREIHTSHGTERFFARPCLRRSMHDVARLPRQCARVYRGYRGTVTGYNPRCLHQYGWRRG